jgi:hypothetical protein
VCVSVCNRAPPGLVSKVHRASLQLSRKCLPRRRSARKCPALSTSARRVQLTWRPTEPSWNTSREGVFTSTLFSSYPSHNSRALALLREQPACALLESAHSEYMKLRSGTSKCPRQPAVYNLLGGPPNRRGIPVAREFSCSFSSVRTLRTIPGLSYFFVNSPPAHSSKVRTPST